MGHLKFNYMCKEKIQKSFDGLKCIWKGQLRPIWRQFCGVAEVVFYTILPTFIVLLFMSIDKDGEIEYNQLYIRGEFLLYSIALLSSSYTTMKVYKNQNTSLVVILIIVTSILYSITVKAGPERIKEYNLLWFSVFTFSCGLISTWRAMKLKDKDGDSFHDLDNNASSKIQEKLNYGENR